MVSKHKRKQRYNWRFYKELVLAFLAILSVLFVAYEFIANPHETTVQIIMLFDIVVALLFLTDFMVALLHSKDKNHYLKNNWYLLLASIPILDSWAELLRGLRLLELVRLVRAGEHLSYVIHTTKK